MTGDKTLVVSDSRVRCTGPETAPHHEIILRLPKGLTRPCPICGQKYRRHVTEKRLINANWPQRK